MQSFKSFFESNNKNKYVYDKKGYVIMHIPAGIGREPNDKSENGETPLTEENDNSRPNIAHHDANNHYNKNGGVSNDYANAHKKHQELSDKLHQSTAATLNAGQRKNVRNYTKERFGHSRDINQTLNDNAKSGKKPVEGMHPDHAKTHWTIKYNAKPSGHDFHVYAGKHHSMAEAGKHSKDNIVHHASHLSTSHDIHIAHGFARQKRNRAENGDTHLMHVHVKPHNKVLHVEGHSESKGEHETIIPSGAKLKYSHTTTHDHHEPLPGQSGKPKQYDKHKVHIHHYTIHQDGK